MNARDPIERLNTALEGRYRIERELGAGGMATVYLAEDLKHHRSVALKVLKPELAAVVGADRFLAEIETTANLQHPHILPLYDSGEADSFLFYVMPYVEGESLRGRIDRQKQLPVGEAVRIARAVAEALDYAHRHGVIHRDIKPANILIQDGQPLVADFGIALAVGAAGGTRLTETGLSVGTPYYMSPEQATGDQAVGPASDIYSLACVLYEMLTGDPPYMGSTAQAVLGQIIAAEAKPATRVRSSVPPNVDAALRKALEKLPADRFTSARAFADALDDAGFRYGDGEVRAGDATGLWSRLGPVFLVLFLVAAGIAVWSLFRSEPEQVVRMKIGFDPGEDLWYTGLNNPSRVSIAPDGSRFVYTGSAGAREQMLWLRSVSELNGEPLGGTEGGVGPAISPDGARVGYLHEVEGYGYSIRVVSLAGGTPVTLVEGPVHSMPFWGPDGSVYFMASPFTLARVSGAGGGIDTVVTLPTRDRLDGYAHPYVLEDGRGVIVTGVDDETRGHRVLVFDLETGRLTASVPGARGFLTPTGRFGYVTADGVLMIQAFDRGALAPVGNPVPVEWDLDVRQFGWVDLALSESGTLLYILENTQAPERWVWVDEDGNTEPVDPDWTRDTEFESVELSPDGTRMAVEMERDGRYDIWIKRLAGGAPSRLTFRGERNSEPAWSPDGSRVAFVSASTDGRDAWVREADGSGSAELLLDLEPPVHEVLWTPDGERLVAVVLQPSYDIVTVDPDAADAAPTVLLGGSHNENEPAISPGGRWLAYTSDETGRAEVFVVPFPNVDDGKWQVSTAGGREPRWSADGRRLYVRHGDGSGLDVVDMGDGPTAAERSTVFDVPPEEYFELNPDNHMYDVTPDGRILMLEAGSGDISGDMVMVQSWLADVERRLKGGDR